MTTPVGPVATCPKCASASLTIIAVEKKNIGTAILAEYFAGTAAGVTVGTKTIPVNRCMNCGFQYVPNTREERETRALSGQQGPDEKKKTEDAIRNRKKQEDAQRAAEEGTKFASCALIVALVALVVLFVGLSLTN